MDWFKQVKRFYDEGKPRYDNEGVKVFVKAGYITAEQYQEITGVDYTE